MVRWHRLLEIDRQGVKVVSVAPDTILSTKTQTGFGGPIDVQNTQLTAHKFNPYRYSSAVVL